MSSAMYRLVGGFLGGYLIYELPKIESMSAANQEHSGNGSLTGIESSTCACAHGKQQQRRATIGQ